MHNSIQLIDQEVQQHKISQQTVQQAPPTHTVASVPEQYQISQEPVLSPGVPQQPIAYKQMTPMQQSNLVQMPVIQAQQTQVSRQYIAQQNVHQSITQPGHGVSQNLSQSAVSIQQSQTNQNQPDNIADIHPAVYNQPIISQQTAAQPNLMTRTPSNIGKQHPSQPIQNVAGPGQRPQTFATQSVSCIGQAQSQVNLKRS